MSKSHVAFVCDSGDEATIMFYENEEFQELFHGSVDELSEWMGQDR